MRRTRCSFLFNDTATTEIYTLSLHDALPIYRSLPLTALSCEFPASMSDRRFEHPDRRCGQESRSGMKQRHLPAWYRSEEHTSELQSRQYLVCRLLLEQKTIRFPIPYLAAYIL